MFILNRQKGIISLATVFSVGLLALSMALMNSLGVLTELSKSRNTAFGDRSFYNAEAAAREGVYQFISTTSYSGGDPQILNNNSSGTINVVDLGWPNVAIEGIIDNQFVHREVFYTVNIFAEGFAFDHAVFSKNNLHFGGNVQVDGNIFAENEISFSGSSATINGDAFSSSEISPSDNITGEINSFVDPIPPPQIDLQPYINVAQSGGTFFNTSTEAQSYLNGNERNAVIFVDQTSGKTKIQSANTVLTGSLVVRNNLELAGGTYTADNNYLAIIVLGDLKITGGTQINGIVYVLGSASFGAGGGTINGSLISAENISDTNLTGNAQIIYNESFVGDWQNIQGLSTTSVAAPVITGWGEK